MPEAEPFSEALTTGLLHVPPTSRGEGLVLAHGAGTNCRAPLLAAVAEAFAAEGFHVLRCDLPFRQRKRFGPPHPAQAGDDRKGLLAAASIMRRLVSGRLILGGHSYGGRQASILASEDRSVADELLLLSYPLHPPSKPDQLRTSHFGELFAPSIFVHGTRDPFGSVAEMLAALPLIAGATQFSVVEGAGHDLKGGKFDLSGSIVRKFKV